MKVIDLLNKIANGEEVPNKITIGNSPFELTLSRDGKYYSGNTDSVLNDVLGMNKLNEEVEIIEEDKKIKKIEHWIDVKSWLEGNDLEKGLEEQSEFNKNIYYKINEIIEYLEENK